MTMFDDRERAYEKKFMLDEEMKFKLEARRIDSWVNGRPTSSVFRGRQPTTTSGWSATRVLCTRVKECLKRCEKTFMIGE